MSGSPSISSGGDQSLPDSPSYASPFMLPMPRSAPSSRFGSPDTGGDTADDVAIRVANLARGGKFLQLPSRAEDDQKVKSPHPQFPKGISLLGKSSASFQEDRAAAAGPVSEAEPPVPSEDAVAAGSVSEEDEIQKELREKLGSLGHVPPKEDAIKAWRKYDRNRVLHIPLGNSTKTRTEREKDIEQRIIPWLKERGFL